MLKILQIGMTDNLGGIESFLKNYYDNFSKEEIQFDFVNIYDNDLCFQDIFEKNNSKIYKLTSYYKRPIKYIKELKRLINDNDYQIVHCNMNSAVFLYPLIAGKLSKAKVVIAHSHNSSSDKGMLKSILHNINKVFIPMFANYFFACSNVAGEWFFSKKVLASDKYYVINNAVNSEKFKFDKNNRGLIRKELNISDKDFVVGHVGRFNKQKNHTFLLDIFNEIQKSEPHSKLLLVGVGPLYEETKNKVKELEIDDKVIFLKNRSDVNKVMSAMDAFVLPSLYEGLPLVGVEAQASGLPCFFSKDITKEINITDNVKYIDLCEKTEIWGKEILESKKRKLTIRKDASEQIVMNNFDICSEAKKLQKLYVKILREND